MPPVDIGPVLEQFYTSEELIELLRANLRNARALPPGAQRNQYRKVARSLRAHFESKNGPVESTLTARNHVSIKTN